MKKTAVMMIATAIFMVNSTSFGASLTSLNQAQFEAAFVNKTAGSIPTDNLNGKTINNTFSMYLDNQGHIWGKMSIKPSNEPQTDQGVYTIKKDGTVYLTWQHWDGAKQLCFRSFATANAYLNIGCDDVFHTAFMKTSIQTGNKL